MTTHTKLLVLCVASLLLCYACGGGGGAPSTAGGPAVAVAKNGAILYSQGYGYADLGTCLQMPANAEMQIGSVTKQFTAAAVLQLYSAGTLDIDKPLITYLPTYAFDPRITLRMLLNQTSGLQDYLSFPELGQYITGGPESVALNAIVQRTLNFTPVRSRGESPTRRSISPRGRCGPPSRTCRHGMPRCSDRQPSSRSPRGH